MYVEPDCNIPAAESLIRQCLYGQLYYREAFGITVDNAWLPDVFGNSWILPQILKKSGVDYFVSNKCPHGTTQTAFRTTISCGRELTAPASMPVCSHTFYYLEYAQPDSGKLGCLPG